MRPFLTALALIPMLTCLGTARAQDVPGSQNLILDFLKSADADADGLVTKAEAEAFVQRTRKEKADETAKAWVDLVAFVGAPAGAEEMQGKDYAAAIRRAFDAADADKDGSVTAKERSAYLATLPDGAAKVIVTDVMSSLDADRDDVISATEVATAVEAISASGTMSLKVISDAAKRQADTEGLLFRMMAESNGDAEGRIRVADFEKAAQPVEPTKE